MKGKLLQRLTRDIDRLGSPRKEVAVRAQWRLLRSAARLRRYGPRAIQRLIAATAHPNPQVRFRAVWVLAATRAPGACETALALIQDADPAVRYDAVMALGSFGYVEAIPILIDLACQPPREDCLDSAAAISLLYLGYSAVAPLVPLLKSENPRARDLAAYGLGRIGPPAVAELLVRRLQDPDAAVRLQAVDALGLLGERFREPGYCEPLGQCVDDLCPAIRQETAFWLAEAASWPKKGTKGRERGSAELIIGAEQKRGERTSCRTPPPV